MESTAWVLFDGSCGLCNRLVRFVLERDRRGVFLFAPLQSPSARRVLLRHGRDPERLDTLVLVLEPDRPGERLLERSAAALAILRRLGGVWGWLAALRIVPRALRDRGYDAVARNRHRWPADEQSCRLPAAHVRQRFLDAGESCAASTAGAT